MKEFMLSIVMFMLAAGGVLAQSMGRVSWGVTEPPATVVEVASSNEDFSTLTLALLQAELVEVLSGEGPFTVFAPTNEVFAANLRGAAG